MVALLEECVLESALLEAADLEGAQIKQNHRNGQTNKQTDNIFIYPSPSVSSSFL